MVIDTQKLPDDIKLNVMQAFLLEPPKTVSLWRQCAVLFMMMRHLPKQTKIKVSPLFLLEAVAGRICRDALFRPILVRLLSNMNHDETMSLFLLSAELAPSNSSRMLTLQGGLGARLVQNCRRARERNSVMFLIHKYPFDATRGVDVTFENQKEMDSDVVRCLATTCGSWLRRKVRNVPLYGFNAMLLRMAQRFVMDRGVGDVGRMSLRINELWYALGAALIDDHTNGNSITGDACVCGLAGATWMLVSIVFSAIRNLVGSMDDLIEVVRERTQTANEISFHSGVCSSALGVDFLVAFPDVDESLPNLVAFVEFLYRVLGTDVAERWIVELCRRPDWACVLLRLCNDSMHCNQLALGANDHRRQPIGRLVCEGLLSLHGRWYERAISNARFVSNLSLGASAGPPSRAFALGLRLQNSSLMAHALRLLAAETTTILDPAIFFDRPVRISQQRCAWQLFRNFRLCVGPSVELWCDGDLGAMVATALAVCVLLSEALSRGEKRRHCDEWCDVVDRVAGEVLSGQLPFDARAWPRGHALRMLNRAGVVRAAFPSLACLLWHRGGDAGKDEVRDMLSGSNVLRQLQRIRAEQESPTTQLGKRSRHSSFRDGAGFIDPIGGKPDELFALSSVCGWIPNFT